MPFSVIAFCLFVISTAVAIVITVRFVYKNVAVYWGNNRGGKLLFDFIMKMMPFLCS